MLCAPSVRLGNQGVDKFNASQVKRKRRVFMVPPAAGAANAAGDPGSKKYDRQLRVWGADGQAALAGARVCLLGSGATGAEALKNLVLGGIAAFTVIDDALVRDVGMHGAGMRWRAGGAQRAKRKGDASRSR